MRTTPRWQKINEILDFIRWSDKKGISIFFQIKRKRVECKIRVAYMRLSNKRVAADAVFVMLMNSLLTWRVQASCGVGWGEFLLFFSSLSVYTSVVVVFLPLLSSSFFSLFIRIHSSWHREQAQILRGGPPATLILNYMHTYASLSIFLCFL